MKSIRKARAANADYPDVPNRTKVVRLFVVPGRIDPDNATQVSAYARGRHATRQDVFCVKNPKGTWVPMSWLGGKLEEHHAAADKNPEVVVVLSATDREQIQWECDVDFWVSGIRTGAHQDFPKDGNPPATPFRKDLPSQMGAPGKPVISGPIDWSPTHKPFDQLYKFTFTLVIPGERDNVQIDPDVFCDWQ
jgi:hypothetical protein